ncbi:MAG: isoprenylcysteine carboxylmethyltransferase family protein [Candidatus Omnitrophica bacterium]|nr:isoprenylcysteine carboxylmethyltransferase family protein [Candidatus Omnitrophota bacterium]
MKRILTFVYGVASYALFFLTFLYMIGFLGNFAVPKTIDNGTETSLPLALMVNVSLVLLFGLQHSVMARPGFKRMWTRIVPQAAERSTYVLMSSLALILLMWQWRPMTSTVWSIESVMGQSVMYALFGMGWLTVLITTFLINHFDLFGLRQVTLYLMGRDYTSLGFVTPGPYKHIRHPLYVGWLMAFWATPTMTVGHFLFAGLQLAYILVAIRYEERDLVEFHGEDYANYREKTPMFIPKVGREMSPEPQTEVV